MAEQMDGRNRLVTVLVVVAIAAALGLRIWWVWPEELPGGPHLQKIEKRGRDYTLHLKAGSSLSDIAALHVFEGYSPSTHFDFEESVSDRPSKYVQDDDHHHYVEYVLEHGRMEFHTEFHPEIGIGVWVELLPTDLAVDAFFAADVAVNLDLTKDRFKVFIPPNQGYTYMTVFVSDRKVNRIAWLDY